MFLFYLCIYPPDLLTCRGANTWIKQLPRPALGDAKILPSACNLMKI